MFSHKPKTELLKGRNCPFQHWSYIWKKSQMLWFDLNDLFGSLWGRSLDFE